MYFYVLKNNISTLKILKTKKKIFDFTLKSIMYHDN